MSNYWSSDILLLFVETRYEKLLIFAGKSIFACLVPHIRVRVCTLYHPIQYFNKQCGDLISSSACIFSFKFMASAKQLCFTLEVLISFMQVES